MAFKISQKHIRFGAIGAVAVAGAVSYLRPSPMQPDPDLLLLARQAGFLQAGRPEAARAEAAAPLTAAGEQAESPATLPEAGEVVPEVTRGTARPAAAPVLQPELPLSPDPVLLPESPAVPGDVAHTAPSTAPNMAAAAAVSPPSTPEPAGAEPDCTPSVKTIPVPGGLVHFRVEAPCVAPGPAEVSHAGLSVTLDMPPSRRLTTTVPLLDIEEPFRVGLADGTVIEQKLETAAATAFEHVVLQWKGDTGLQLHVLEFGAGYGSSGHVWAGAPKEVLRGVRGEGGFLTRLGSPELGNVADVYSYPAEAMDGAADLAMTVEAEITPANCGRDISGEILQRSLDGSIDSVEVMFAVPGCDAVGDILVLKNMLRDRKIAAN